MNSFGYHSARRNDDSIVFSIINPVNVINHEPYSE